MNPITTKDLKLIILGAGAPHRGDVPAALREPRSGTSMLQWLLDSSGCTMAQTVFVAGYQAEAIRARYPDLPVVENSDWEQTGSGASLLATDFPDGQPLLVCYSDILFRESVPAALAATGADIAVAWDSAWKHRYVGRAAEDLARCEKVLVNDGRVVSNFIVQALSNEPITLYGNGTQTRSFCYVDDLIEGFVRLMNMPEDFTGPVNLGNPGEFSMIELAEKVKALTGSRSKLMRKPLPTDDPKQRQPDIRLARGAMGWEPSVKLEEGLKPTIAYFDGLLKA